MKTIILILFLAACQVCFAGGESNIIAINVRSKPVSMTYGQTLRARMMIAQEHSPAHAGKGMETEVRLELPKMKIAVPKP